MENPVLDRDSAALVSLYLRLAITETPVFEDVVKRERRPKVPFLTLLAQQPFAIFIAVGVALLELVPILMNTTPSITEWFQLGFAYYELLHRHHYRWAFAVDHHSLFGAWRCASDLQRCRLGSPRNSPRGVPDILLPPVCELWRPGCHDAHRWNPAHHELGRARWGLQRPLR